MLCACRRWSGRSPHRWRDLKIEKIQQPARDQVILLLRGRRRLLLCAGANQPRLNLTEVLRDNPSQPPMFCMLLRKHLAGGRIITRAAGAPGAGGDAGDPGHERAGRDGPIFGWCWRP